MPNCENDGPRSVLALGKALHFAGAEVVCCIEKELALIIERRVRNWIFRLIGKLTFGIGDIGNEIGLGKIYKQAREINPLGKQCKYPKKEVLITVLETDYLLPAAVSNLGAYGTAAALALLMGRTELLHKPEDELKFITVCRELDCRDGSFGAAHNYVDGVSVQALPAQVEILREMVTQYLNHFINLSQY